MVLTDIQSRLQFINAAENLKNTLRSAYTSTGRQESTAEHTWRLCLFVMTFQDMLGAVDFEKILKLCVLHDLGEAINGDIPATEQQDVPDKTDNERRDLLQLMQPLAPEIQAEFLALWEEYEQADTLEAKVVKAFDKMETLLQHNQGSNPGAINYVFNLSYGCQYTYAHPLFAEIRALIDVETQQKVDSCIKE